MELYLSPTSPYARLVSLVIMEKGLKERCEYHFVNPWESPQELVERNPFSRVPALVTDEGQVITESLLIAFYLERLVPEPALVPAGQEGVVLHKAGIGQGLLDAAVGVVAGRKFDPNFDQNELGHRRFDALDRGLPAAAKAVTSPKHQPDLGDLLLGAALGYLNFRLPDLGWGDDYPGLNRWYEALADRPSMAATRPG